MSKYYDEKAMERTNRYRAEKRDRFSCDFPKGTKERYRKYAEEQGYRSMTAMFIDLVERDMKEKAGE